ncbi:MAG TPA: HIT domain-containing protein [Actinomycetota bacterium]|nr:HIT domain-containing protein [Actinomycetota bacterium]
MNLVHATGTAAWQSMFHFHVHVVPRYSLGSCR